MPSLRTPFMGLTGALVARRVPGRSRNLLAAALAIAILGASGVGACALGSVGLSSDLPEGRSAASDPIGYRADAHEGLQRESVDPASAGSGHPDRSKADAEAAMRPTAAPDRLHGTPATESTVIAAVLRSTYEEGAGRATEQSAPPTSATPAMAPSIAPTVRARDEGPLSTAGPAAPVTPQPTASPTTAITDRGAAFLASMNAERNAHGLQAFVESADLTGIAATRATDMVTLGYFAHVSPSGESWLTLLHTRGVQPTGGGENLARVSGDVTASVAVAIEHLMASPTHRANILSSVFTEVGVAAATDADGVTLFVSIFAAR